MADSGLVLPDIRDELFVLSDGECGYCRGESR